MNSVGLRGASAAAGRHPGGGVASWPAATRPVPAAKAGNLQLQKRLPYIPANTLPLLMEQRKKYLRSKKQRDKGKTPYQERPGEPAGLLSMPEDVLVRSIAGCTPLDAKNRHVSCSDWPLS